MYDFDFGSELNEPVKEKRYSISNKLALTSWYFKTFRLLAFNDLNLNILNAKSVAHFRGYQSASMNLSLKLQIS